MRKLDHRSTHHMMTGIVLACLLLSGCDTLFSKDANRLQDIRERGELVVLTRNAPTTYYEDRDGLAGLEYEMAVAFASHLGVQVRFEVLDSVAAILDALHKGKGDIAAAGLTRTEQRTRSFLFGPSYQMVQQQMVCRRGSKIPKDVKGLAGLHIALIEGSSYVERMEELQSNYPELQWTATRELDTEQLLEQVWLRALDCTVAYSNIVAINRRYFPELVVAFILSKPEPLAWALPTHARDLKTAVEEWFARFQDGGELEALLERYYGFVDLFDYVDIQIFKRRIPVLLPRYHLLFAAAGRRYGFPWTLLAAQAYQESHWNPMAKSPTGVRGIMMLTQRTATAVGVSDRLDSDQSIMGGAKYLNGLYRRMEVTIQEPDRTWFTLAAYNVGMGHVHDAQTLARRLGKNPHLWNDLKTVLPLLAQKRYYRTLKHGYARGREPVRYVQRIRDFQDILERSLPEMSLPPEGQTGQGLS